MTLYQQCLLCVALLFAAEVHSIEDWTLYADKLEGSWENWSWDTDSQFSLCADAPTYQGACSIAADLQVNGAISLYHTPFYSTSWLNLSFAIHGGADGNQQLTLFVHDQNDAILNKISLNDPSYLTEGIVKAGEWRLVTVPIGDLIEPNQLISRFSIQAVNDQPLFYLDAIQLQPKARPEHFAIAVDASEEGVAIPTTVFGANAAHWNANLHQNTDLIAKIASADFSVVRFPGGSAANRYHWQDHEPETENDQWMTNTTEFIEFARQIGAEPMITLNVASGNLQEAVDWLTYTNKTHDWHVRYWECGNEIYGDWEEDSWTHDPVDYMEGNDTHAGCNSFCEALKAVDSTIQFSIEIKDPRDSSDWNQKVLEKTNACIDFVSMHYYRLAAGQHDYFSLLMDAPGTWSVIGEQLTEVSSRHDLKVGITEYNSYFGGNDDPPESLAAETVNLLFLADTLGQIITQGFEYANHWDIINGDYPQSRWGLLLESNDNYRQPSYYAYPLWRKMGDRLLHLDSNADPSTQLSVYATKHSDACSISLLAINKAESWSGTIALTNFTPSGRILSYVAQGDSLQDASVSLNGEDSQSLPKDLTQVSPIVDSINSPVFSYQFPAYSVTSLTIEGRDPVCGYPDPQTICSDQPIAVGPIHYDGQYEIASEQAISTENEVIVTPGSVINYQAPYISLTPGFHVQTGATFETKASNLNCH